MLRIQNIKLRLDEDKSILPHKIAKKLRINLSDIIEFRIFKEAIDARKKPDIYLVYTIDVVTKKDIQILKKNPSLEAPSMAYDYPESGTTPLENRPVVVGAGPCGLFAALILAQKGYRPILLERGKKVEERIEDVKSFWENGKLDPKSNVQFGEGGAGTFSDGKLTTQIKNKRCHKVLEELVEAGAPKEILYKNKPHVGTDILRDVVRNIRQTIIHLGGEVRFNAQVTGINIENDRLKSIIINETEILKTQICVLAIGHSARDTFYMLYEGGIPIIQKPFSMGMRVEHLQSWINEAQYGQMSHHSKLGAAEYKLTHHAANGRGVYSFCMCPGGEVIASASEEGMVVTNGMSEHRRDQENANSAILVSIGTEDFGSKHPLAGVELQRRFEKLGYDLGGKNYYAPVQRLEDFLKAKESTCFGKVKPSYRPGTTFANLREALPPFMGDAIAEAMTEFGKKIKNFDHPDALFTGFETRSSSPVRIPRDTKNLESIIKGIYPAGEGAGYAGGITSAAVDGIEVAEQIIMKYQKPEQF